MFIVLVFVIMLFMLCALWIVYFGHEDNNVIVERWITRLIEQMQREQETRRSGGANSPLEDFGSE